MPQPLADDFVTLYRSPDPQRIFAYSPGLCRLPSGRLVATMDQGGPGVAELSGPVGHGHQAILFTSDDRGATWQERARAGMLHGRPFVAGDSVYFLGHAGDLTILRSDDDGATWSAPARLTAGERWHQAPCNVDYHAGRVYLVMEREMEPYPGWPVSVLAPVVMAAPVSTDLTRRESWTCSNALSFNAAVAQAGQPNLLGVPFFGVGPATPDNPTDRRHMVHPGWLEANVARIVDPDHLWHDPAGRRLHLLLRAHTGRAGYACLARADEDETGAITVGLEHAPSGEAMLYTPCPGGHLKFHLLSDPPSRLYWLLSSLSSDTMTRPDRLPPERYNLPYNERNRLGLHCSRNLVDWRFAGLVAAGPSPKQSRHYASMAIDGDDLLVLSRSGDAAARTPHDGNLITFHVVRGFRELAW